MNREQAVKYLQSSGFSDEQIKAIEGAFTCDKCVYSTSEGCQYDDITETIPPFETSDDAISRQAVLDITWEEPSYTDAMNVLTEVRDKVKELPSVNPKQKWIPVSERLPEEYCLFCDIDGDVFYGHIYDDRWWAEGQDDRIKNVIAWMPLPEPCKTEGSEAE